MIWSRKNKRDGVKYWFVRYRKPDGYRKVEKVPPVLDAKGRIAKHPTKQDAENFLILRKAQVLNGTWVDGLSPISADELTFDQFADRFLADYVQGRCRSDYYDLALRPMRKHFGPRALRAITAADIDGYPAQCREVDEVGPSTIRKRLTILGTMFKMARRWGIVDANPAADVAKPGEPEHRTRYLEPAEWRKLAAEAAPWLRPILTMSIATGARLKEIVGLRWEDVDTARGFLTFTSGNKTARSRTVVIGRAIKAVLAGQRRAQVKAGRLGPWVFVDRHGSPYTSVRARNMIGQRTKAAMKAAGIKGASLHALRHTVGTWAAIDGRSESEIAKQLGHATTQTTRRYVNLLPEHLKQLTKGIDSRLVGSQMGHRSKKAGTRKAHK